MWAVSLIIFRTRHLMNLKTLTLIEHLSCDCSLYYTKIGTKWLCYTFIILDASLYSELGIIQVRNVKLVQCDRGHMSKHFTMYCTLQSNLAILLFVLTIDTINTNVKDTYVHEERQYRDGGDGLWVLSRTSSPLWKIKATNGTLLWSSIQYRSTVLSDNITQRYSVSYL